MSIMPIARFSSHLSLVSSVTVSAVVVRGHMSLAP